MTILTAYRLVAQLACLFHRAFQVQRVALSVGAVEGFATESGRRRGGSVDVGAFGLHERRAYPSPDRGCPSEQSCRSLRLTSRGGHPC